MADRYDDYFRSFYIKQFEHWKEVYQKTKNKEAFNRMQELKDFIYRRWLIELDSVDKIKPEKSQQLLFEF